MDIGISQNYLFEQFYSLLIVVIIGSLGGVLISLLKGFEST